jgi:pentatricopeptide repeat protein
MIQIHSIHDKSIRFPPHKKMGRKPIRGRSKARNLVNAFSYSSAIVACGSAKRWQCALELWEAMTNRGPAPNVVAMNALLGTENHELMDRGDGFGGSPLSLSLSIYIYRSNDINHIYN